MAYPINSLKILGCLNKYPQLNPLLNIPAFVVSFLCLGKKTNHFHLTAAYPSGHCSPLNCSVGHTKINVTLTSLLDHFNDDDVRGSGTT